MCMKQNSKSNVRTPLLYIYIYIYIYIGTRFRPSAYQKQMMVQQAQNNIFVREWILQVRLDKSHMGHNRLYSHQKDKKTQFEGNNIPRSSPGMKCSYIHSSFSKYKIVSPCFVCFSSYYIPYLSRGSLLYIVLFIFNPQPSTC